MDSFWVGFEKQAGIANIGRSIGRGVSTLGGSFRRGASTTGGSIKSMTKSVVNAPKNLRKGYQQGRAAVRNEAALLRPVKKQRGANPMGIKAKTTSATKSQHYRDIKTPKPDVESVVKSKAPPNSPASGAMDFAKKHKKMLAAGAAGTGIGYAASRPRNDYR